MSDNATADQTHPARPAADAGPHRPDYGRPGRARRPSSFRRPAVLAAAVLLAAAAGTGVWAQGRGFKTALLRRAFPDDPKYMTKPTVTAVRPADRDGGVPPTRSSPPT
jgi:hypothetical protein